MLSNANSNSNDNGNNNNINNYEKFKSYLCTLYSKWSP